MHDVNLRAISDAADASLDALRGKRVAVLGFGNQGAAHALNLRDAGLEVVVANRSDSTNGRSATAAGFALSSIPEAVRSSQLIIVALPDEAQPGVWETEIAAHLKPGVTVGFLHGFSIHYRHITPGPDIGVIMVAPKGPGATLRAQYELGQGIPCLLAVHQDSPAADAESIGLGWAAGLGCARAAIVFTTFAHETETDLFGEQCVLCGGMTELILAAFQTLVEAGYPPSLAYMECCQEVKQVADLVYERGLAATMQAISNTAEYGTYVTGPRLIDEGVRARMQEILAEIQDGTFARTVRDDHADGFPWFTAQRERGRAHPIEAAGRSVRSWMPWLQGGAGDAPPAPPASQVPRPRPSEQDVDAKV